MCYENLFIIILDSFKERSRQMKKLLASALLAALIITAAAIGNGEAAKKMDNSDTFVDTWRAMMESNYLKEAQPHEGSYHMHLNELLVNVTA